jgi:hypothetical protein
MDFRRLGVRLFPSESADYLQPTLTADLDWLQLEVRYNIHVYQTDREIQRGLLGGLSFDPADFRGYVFNPDEGTPTVVIALRVSW